MTDSVLQWQSMCVYSKTEGESTLRIEVNEKNATTKFGKGCAKTDSCSCLSDSAFLINDLNDS